MPPIQSGVVNAETVSPVRTAYGLFADTSNPLLRLKFLDRSTGADAPSSPDEYHAIEIINNGSTDNRLIVFLNIGPSSTDYTQNQFSAGAVAVSDPSSVDASPTHTQCATLGALIEAMNGVDGMYVNRLHAPADLSLDTDDFITLAEEDINAQWGEYLYQDVSEVLTFARRFGVPDNVNGEIGAGQLKLIGIQAFCNSGGATDCIIVVSRDPDETDATEEEELWRDYVADASVDPVFDEHEEPMSIVGPVLVEVIATTSLAANAWFRARYRSVEY
jgi:hypothetical protein